MCRSGSAADTQAISDYVRYFLAAHAVEINRPPTVKTAAVLARKLCYENKVTCLNKVVQRKYTLLDIKNNFRLFFRMH